MALIFKKKPAPVAIPAPRASAPAPTPTAAEAPAPTAPLRKPTGLSIRPAVKPTVLPVSGKPLPPRASASAPILPVQSVAPTKVVKLAPPEVQESKPIKADIHAKPAALAFPKVHIGDRVLITKSLFPLVKHYKVGDKGYVKFIMPDFDPLGLAEDGSCQTHIVVIDEPIDPGRKGQTAALFRKEFDLA